MITSNRSIGLLVWIVALLSQLLAGEEAVEVGDDVAAGAGRLGVEFSVLALFQTLFIGPDRAVLVPLPVLHVRVGVFDGICGLVHGRVEELQDFAAGAGLLGAEVLASRVRAAADSLLVQ